MLFNFAPENVVREEKENLRTFTIANKPIWLCVTNYTTVFAGIQNINYNNGK